MTTPTWAYLAAGVLITILTGILAALHVDVPTEIWSAQTSCFVASGVTVAHGGVRRDASRPTSRTTARRGRP
jgi:hypothetical protein